MTHTPSDAPPPAPDARGTGEGIVEARDLKVAREIVRLRWCASCGKNFYGHVKDARPHNFVSDLSEPIARALTRARTDARRARTQHAEEVATIKAEGAETMETVCRTFAAVLAERDALAERLAEARALLIRYRAHADNDDVLTGVDEDTDDYFRALTASRAAGSGE